MTYCSEEALDLNRSPILVTPKFHDVPFNLDRYPGAPGVSGLNGGANCQLFAYEFLRGHGFVIPDLRSSDLWKDTEHTFAVASPEPFDLANNARRVPVFLWLMPLSIINA